MSRKLLGIAAALGLAAVFAARADSDPTPTPTPGPRLSGGFGRAAVTPAAPGDTGQSLADVVRAAGSSRKKTEAPKPAVAITNDSLVTDPNRGKLTFSQPPPKTPPARGGTPGRATPGRGAATPTPTAAASVTPEPGSAENAPAGEEEWKEIARRARLRVTEGKSQVEQLDAEARKLESDFYSWDDGQYRDNVIKPAWDRKREELETARRELADAERDLADLPERARKAGALPGWIRE